MRVFILNPPYVTDFVRSARWAARSRGRVQRHPDYLLIATSLLEKERHKVNFLDGAALNLTMDQVLTTAKEFKPEITILHTTTPSIYNDINYAKEIKKITGSFTILIGNHVTAEPEDTFKIANGSVDLIVRGEYDFTLSKICNDPDDIEIDGISYEKDGRVINNPPAPLEDVDKLPFPAWHYIKPEWYHDAGKLFPFLTLISGRGCFAKCTFCQDPQLFTGHRLRMRSPEIVVDEIEYDYKLFPYIREIMFETDTFVAQSSHVTGVCEEILKRKLNITWSCNVRVDMNIDLLPLMKKAGCRMLMTGFEFGTQNALDAVKKGTTLEQSLAFAEKAHELGFIIHGCFMIGAPGETEQSAIKTIEFAKSLPLDTIQISGICVYPGTEMYQWAKKNGFLVPKDWTEWVSKDYEQVTLLNYPQLKKEKIDELIDRGLREFYFRPKQILKMLFNIRSWSDVKRKIYGGLSFIKYNLSSIFKKREHL